MLSVAGGHTHFTTENLSEGLAMIEAKKLRPLAITLDVMMPDLDGWSVLAALRQDPELAELAQDVAPEKVLDTMDAHQQQMDEDGRRAKER